MNQDAENQVDVRLVKVADVRVSPDPSGRPLRPVTALAQSIGSVGLIEPIVVDGDMMLIAGRHRLEACRGLGHEQILARVLTVESIERELIAIDENLCRNVLDPLEKGELLARRKELYELRNPAAKQGGAPGMSGGGKAKNPGAEGFVVDTASLTRRGKTSISEDVKIGRMAADVREQLRGSTLATRKKDLLEVSRMPPDRQRRVAEIVAQDRGLTLDAALDAIEPVGSAVAGRVVDVGSVVTHVGRALPGILDDLGDLVEAERMLSDTFDFFTRQRAAWRDVPSDDVDLIVPRLSAALVSLERAARITSDELLPRALCDACIETEDDANEEPQRDQANDEGVDDERHHRGDGTSEGHGTCIHCRGKGWLSDADLRRMNEAARKAYASAIPSRPSPMAPATDEDVAIDG